MLGFSNALLRDGVAHLLDHHKIFSDGIAGSIGHHDSSAGLVDLHESSGHVGIDLFVIHVPDDFLVLDSHLVAAQL